MKRGVLIKHLTRHRCFLLREGKKHSVYYNPKAEKTSTVPRHSEVIDVLAKKICKDLDIPSVKK